MSEEDIKANFISCYCVSKGWKNGEHIAYEEYFTWSRWKERGEKARRRRKKIRLYTVLPIWNSRIAIVEAKDNKHSVRAGLQQAIEYGEILDVPFDFFEYGDGLITRPYHERRTWAGVRRIPYSWRIIFSRETKERIDVRNYRSYLNSILYRRLLNENATLLSANSYLTYYWNSCERGQKSNVFDGNRKTENVYGISNYSSRLQKAFCYKRVLFFR